MTGGRRPYHHGDLRRALLAAGLELASERGPEGFSLREAARRAGVSHGAPYHHFADRDALLHALAAESFERLGARLAAAAAEHEEPLTRMEAVVAAYVAFGLEQPARFRLMWRHDPRIPRDAEALARRSAEQRSFGLLTGTLREAERRGAIAPRPDDLGADRRAGSVWAAAHGLTDLLLAGQLGPVGVDAALGELLRLVRSGLGAHGGEGASAPEAPERARPAPAPGRRGAHPAAAPSSRSTSSTGRRGSGGTEAP